jgi:integrase
MNSYRAKKGLKSAKVKKSDRVKYLLPSEVGRILNSVERTAGLTDAQRRRDHCMIYCGYYLGMRAGEVGIMKRRALRDLDAGVVYIQTLKQANEARISCKDCNRKYRVKYGRGAREMGDYCPKCQCYNPLPDDASREPPEVEVRIMEKGVAKYLRQYMKDTPRGQEFMFTSLTRKNIQLTPRHLNRIFSTYCAKAGLSPKISFHALRHGRGVVVWEATHDLKFLQECMRHKSLNSSEIYMHISPGKLTEYKGKLDGLLASTAGQRPTDKDTIEEIDS